MSYEPLHHKYRPQTFADLVGQEAIAQTLTNAILTERIAPAYLFTGPRGTGKTSSARILAKSLNCLKQDQPTESPCGRCEVCKSIASGYAVDVIEIDAASNTGVDNIRELIEKSQFAPVQCRYKVYVIDECLTGDSLVLTREGLVRIDNPHIKDKKVLSYNDSSGEWEFQRVLRWLDQGERETLVIKTTNQKISCTANHLIRTNQGWIPAKNLKEGAKILSPVNVDAESSFTNLEQVESVKVAGVERVYDIEVESNHNFVANGLLVHNCHMLSTAAFNALLKTLEEPPKHVVFVLATTDPQRVLPTIISRCQKFDFRRIPLEAMVQHLQKIASQEKINITFEALTLVAQVAQGGLRDAESLLDQLSLLPEQVTVERVWDLVGAVPEQDLMELTIAIASDNSEALLDSCRQLMDRGREPLVVLQNLAGFYRDLLIAHTAPNRGDLVAVTPPTWKQLCEFAQKLPITRILQGQQHLRNSEVQIKNTTQPRLWLEVTLLGLLPSAGTASVASPPPVLHSSTVSKQEPQTPRNPSPTGLPRHSAASPVSPVETGGASVVSPESKTPSPDQSTASNSVSNPQTFQSQSPAIEMKASPAGLGTATLSSPTSTSVKSPISQAPSAIATDLEQPVDEIAPSTLPEAIASLYTIEEIWQQVLEHLQPFATQALLRQHCQLISFEGSIARVGISSQPLMKLAQEKLPNIEAAFESVYKSKVKVSLQTKATKPPNTAAANEPTVRRVVAEPTPQPAVTQPISKDLPTQKSRQVLPVLEEGEKETEVHAKWGREGENTAILEKEIPRIHASERGDVLTETLPLFPVTESAQALSVQDMDLDMEEIEKALGNLKQFFEGEIVDLSDDFSKREAVSTQLLDTENRDDDDTERLEVELQEDQNEVSLSKLAATHQWQASELAALEIAELHNRREMIEYDEDGDIAF